MEAESSGIDQADGVNNTHAAVLGVAKGQSYARKAREPEDK
jgi:hypothetical protein